MSLISPKPRYAVGATLVVALGALYECPEMSANVRVSEISLPNRHSRAEPALVETGAGIQTPLW